MRVVASHELAALGGLIPPFLDLVGRERWFKRVDHLNTEQLKSPFQWRIVSDYHWLEMAVSFQLEVLEQEGCLRPELADELTLAALNFAATTVEVHTKLSPAGQRSLEGRLRDCLKSQTGFAPLYLELDLAQRLMDAGFDVAFTDMEGTAQFDLLFSRGSFAGEVECKSLSADAGRQIHRKDFYRFMDAVGPHLEAQRSRRRREVLVITLDARLSPDLSAQEALRIATKRILGGNAPGILQGDGFVLARQDLDTAMPDVSTSDATMFYEACRAAFGPSTHVAGSFTRDGGCAVVMRSRREDDTSKPMLEAMRKAASQFSRERPAFIAIQEHGIEVADLMLPHVRRRAATLSYALFGHYGGSHVNATYVTGFGALVARNGKVGTPAFAVPNPQPKFPAGAADAPPFLADVSDKAYAAAIGAPLPAQNISFAPLKPTERSRSDD